MTITIGQEFVMPGSTRHPSIQDSWTPDQVRDDLQVVIAGLTPDPGAVIAGPTSNPGAVIAGLTRNPGSHRCRIRSGMTYIPDNTRREEHST